MVRAAKLALIISILSFVFQARAEGSKGEESGSLTTQKTLWTAHILRRKAGDARIPELEFPERKIPLLLVAKEGRLRPVVEIRGHFKSPGWVVSVAGGGPIEVSADGQDFRLVAYLNGRLNQVLFNAKGPKGELATENVYIYAPEAMEFVVGSAWDRVLLSAGLASLNYYQSGFGNWSAIDGTLSIQYATPPDLPSRWGYYTNLDMEVVTLLSGSGIKTNPNLFEGKADLAFRVTPTRPRIWHTQILAGVSYLTMLSNGSPFGFSNLFAPDLGVRARELIGQNTALIWEAHFVPMQTPMKFGQHGLDFGLTWSRILPSYHRLEVGLAFSQFRFQPDNHTDIDSRLLSLHVGYSL